MKELLSFLSSKTQKAWQKALEEITQTPFVKRLITGDLPASAFTLYLQQDAWYLHEDATLFLNLARKCTKERKERRRGNFFSKNGRRRYCYRASYGKLFL